MGYVGNSPAANFASVTKDTFSGDGSTTAFTLSKAATTNGVAVFVENVRQEPTIAYAVSGTTLTFTAAPVSASGNNIYVLHHNAPASTANHPAAQPLTATSGTFSAGVSGTTGTFTGDVSIDGGDFVFNESGASKDFRVEGDTNANLFIVDGSEDNIGIGQVPSFTTQSGVHLADDYKIGFGAGGNSRPDFQLGFNSTSGELELACGNGADTADVFFNSSGTLGFNLSGGTTCILFEDADNSSATVMTMVNAAYNGGTNKIATFNTTKLSLDPQNSESLLLGTDGSLRLQHVYDDTTSNSANMYIHSDGTHQVLRSTSSERYKKNIETLEDKYADAVLGLRPVWYKSKCEADNADHSHWGLIAEEVAKVDPRLVTFRNEYTEDTGDGNTKVVKLTEPQAESVQYDRFVPHLINICKRQEDKITALEAKVKTLEEA